FCSLHARRYLVTSYDLLAVFSSNATAPSEIYTLSLHDALPICCASASADDGDLVMKRCFLNIFSASLLALTGALPVVAFDGDQSDRKSTRLNSSHDQISYAVFCLKKKKKKSIPATRTSTSTDLT